MAKRKGVSGKTHTKQQLNDYANQNNRIIRHTGREAQTKKSPKNKESL